jgi:protein-disulfide isomerase
MEKGTKTIAGIVVVVLVALTAYALTYGNSAGTGALIGGGSGSSVPNNGNVGNVATGNTEGEDPFFGPEDAAVTIIEYSDFQCPYCANAVPILSQIKAEYGDSVRFVFKDFPLSFHQNAQKAAEAGQCANDQGMFWELHDKMFANQGSIDVGSIKGYAASLGLDTSQFNACLDSGKYASEVQQDFSEGKAAGVSGTPTFFINGKKIVGAQPFSAFKQIIEQELE